MKYAVVRGESRDEGVERRPLPLDLWLLLLGDATGFFGGRDPV